MSFISKLFRKNPKRKAKADLKNAQKDAKWRADYSKALKDLGLNQGNQTKQKTSSHGYGGGSGSGGAKWPFGMSSSYSHTSIDHRRTRAAARNMMQDSSQARSLVDRFADSVVDTGLVMESTPKVDILGITTEEAEKWGRNVSTRFHIWAKSKKSHRAEIYNLYQAQRLYGKWQQRDNDMFTRLFYSKKKDLLSTLQFDFIDPNNIQGYAYTSADYQYTTIDGINRDADGKEISYDIYVVTQNGEIKPVTIQRKGPKSGRTFMLHGYCPEYHAQGRGYSRLSHALQGFENIEDFSAAQIKKAINQSNIVFSMENQQMDPSDPVEGWKRNRASGGPFIDQAPTTTAGTVVDTGKSFEYCPLPEGTLDTPGSLGFVNLQQGDTLKLAENKTPSEGYQKFINPFVSFLSASIGMPIEVMLMSFNANYSASRAALVMFWRICEIWRCEMIADLLDPIYESWLSEEIASGRISAPGWQDPVMRAAWMGNNWIGAPMPSIDPLKEAKANKENLTMSATTQNKIARNLNGSNADDNIAINTRVFSETPIWPGGQTGSQEDKEEDEEGEDK